ncbi:hypothetical protein Taro_019109 [Colocasia esculenta]|uniref:BAG domain-containing protein n=1 Tax=Colocasia esculenta TaxID=4460 RepID=A0A843V4J9_COLES|nr:hypothetical protein [Colocasia esculenta]
MEDPFYRGFWSSHPAGHRAARPAMAKPSRPTKVVPVPVHFVSSDRTKQLRSVAAAANRATKRITPSAAALAIQRAFRAFLVRKNLRSLRQIEAEVDAIENEAARVGDRLRRDARERLRVSETLMAVLFRLDSVRGVREYRRRVIRKAIALQEAVDAIAGVEEPKEGMGAAGNDVGEPSDGNSPLETPAAQEATPAEIPRSIDSDLQPLEITPERRVAEMKTGTRRRPTRNFQLMTSPRRSLSEKKAKALRRSRRRKSTIFRRKKPRA